MRAWSAWLKSHQQHTVKFESMSAYVWDCNIISMLKGMCFIIIWRSKCLAVTCLFWPINAALMCCWISLMRQMSSSWLPFYWKLVPLGDNQHRVGVEYVSWFWKQKQVCIISPHSCVRFDRAPALRFGQHLTWSMKCVALWHGNHDWAMVKKREEKRGVRFSLLKMNTDVKQIASFNIHYAASHALWAGGSNQNSAELLDTDSVLPGDLYADVQTSALGNLSSAYSLEDKKQEQDRFSFRQMYAHTQRCRIRASPCLDSKWLLSSKFQSVYCALDWLDSSKTSPKCSDRAGLLLKWYCKPSPVCPANIRVSSLQCCQETAVTGDSILSGRSKMYVNAIMLQPLQSWDRSRVEFVFHDLLETCSW